MLNISILTEGSPQQLDTNSLLGLRLDYAVGEVYAKSVLLHGGLYSTERESPMPWGTESRLDQVVALENLADIQLSAAMYAPEGWSGRLIMTFMMQNTGAGTRAKVLVRQPRPKQASD